MAWRCYRLIYEAVGPVHIGYHTLGFIKKTRTYIPGKNIWAAITEKLTKALWPEKNGRYEIVGKEVGKHIASTYFYPTSDPVGFSPGPEDFIEGFEAFLTSSAQTAIGPLKLSAERGALYETEYISPSVNGKRVFFVGYLFCQLPFQIDDKQIVWEEKEGLSLKNMLQYLQVGGERRYGFGRLSLTEDGCKLVNETIFCYYHIQSLSSERPVIKAVKTGIPVLAHVKTNSATEIKGDLEPFVGREWDSKKGPGHFVSKAEICWIPGSVLTGGQAFKICEYGLWESSNNSKIHGS